MNALRSLQSRDLRLFTDIVNNPEEDTFPLPAEHWINRELEDKSGNTLLLEAINLHLHDYVDTLLRAGPGLTCTATSWAPPPSMWR